MTDAQEEEKSYLNNDDSEINKVLHEHKEKKLTYGEV